MGAKRRAGFTVIEVMVVVGIIAIVSAIGIAALTRYKDGGAFMSANADLAGGLRKARAQSFGRGQYMAFIVDTVGDADGRRRWFLLQLDSSTFATPSAFTLDDFDPGDPTAFPSVDPSPLPLEWGFLPTGVEFPTAGYGAALPAPFAGVPTLAADSPNYVYCSFCRTSGTNEGFGLVLFEPGGGAIFREAPTAIGQQLVFKANANGANRTMAVAIIEATGLVETFER